MPRRVSPLRSTRRAALTSALLASALAMGVRFAAAQTTALQPWSIIADILTVGGGTSASSSSSVQYTIGAPSVQTMGGGGFVLTPGVVPAQPAPASDLPDAHAYPTPFKPSLGHTSITFTKLTPQAQIDVFTLSGRRVAHFDKNDDTDQFVWNPVVNQQGAPLASGVYLFVIHQDGYQTHTGKILVIK